MRPPTRGGSGHDRWVVPYADLMTLLFAVFATMYAVSTVDAEKLAPAASSLQAAFDRPGTTAAPASATGDVRLSDDAPAKHEIEPAEDIEHLEAALETLTDVRMRLMQELADAIGSGRVEISQEVRGVVLSLPESATFASASADATPEALLLIERIAETLRPLEAAVRVEGHTDDRPIRTVRYRSNWELSTARASAVVAFLVESGEIDAVRLSAAGYGEFHPRVANDSAENRARNRRVDIVVLSPASSRQEPGGSGGAGDLAQF